MQPVDSTVNDENQDVHLSGKCTDRSVKTVENPSSQNIFSSKKKNTLLSRVAYANVYCKRPIFRRKLIEKYSTARYNFNTKCIYSVQTVSKKKCDDSSYSSGKVNSKYTIYRTNSAVVVQHNITDLPPQSFVDAEKSFLRNRHDTVINSTDCEVTDTKRGESSVSKHDEKDVNLEAKHILSRQTPDCIEIEKTSKNASAHPECKLPNSAELRCKVCKPESTLAARGIKSTKNGAVRPDLRALILSRANRTKSTVNVVDSRSSKNLETASSSFSDSEDCDSCESSYLTISYDGDSDSRFSLISDEYSEESYDSLKSKNAAVLTFHSELNSESAQKAKTRNIGELTAKQPDTVSSLTAKNAKSHLNLKRSNLNTAALKLSDSDSDSGLQLCSSDGEKSCSDQLLSRGKNVEFVQLLTANVEKSHKLLFSFRNTNDWVNNSSQNPGQLKLNSGLNVQASSAQILYTDHASKHLSADSNAVPPDVSVDAVSNLTIMGLSSLDGDKKTKTSEAHNLGAACSKPIIGSANQKQFAEKVTTSLNCRSSEKSNFEETDVCDENFCHDSVLLNQTTVHDKAAHSKYKKSVEKWKLVPSTIYQHLAEHYEMQQKDTQSTVVPKKKRKKGTWKNRVGFMRRSLLAKKVPEEPIEIPYRDPYVDTLQELEMNEESIHEPSTEKIGMILHVGVNRPLYPEIYRNIITLNEKTDGEITDLWANFSLTTLITDKSSKRFRSVFLPVVDTKLKSTITEYQKKTCCKLQEVDLQKVTFAESPEEDSANGPLSENVCTKKRKNADSFDDSNTKFLSPDIVEWSPKKRIKEKSMEFSFHQVDFPTVPISALDTSPKSNHLSCIDHLNENSKLAVENSSPDVREWENADEYSISAAKYSESTVKKLSDEALLTKHGYKPCLVLLPRIPIPCLNEEDCEHHFFGADHCSRTYGQMFDYKSRNLSLVFFHRIKRILRLQRQNNKLFRSCRYVHLRPNIDDEFDRVNVLDDCLDIIDVDSKPFPAEVTKNPLGILKTWKLNMFAAPLLKGIDANDSKFPIRFMNQQLLRSEINAKWFILQLNKCLLNVIHQGKDLLPIELLFQIICRADLTKKVVCNTVGMEFDPDVLNFGVYGVPGLCEAVLVGPYESREMQHELTATLQLWTGETACIPILETNFDVNTFFMWNEDTKVRSVYGLWWKPGDSVPCTSAANSVFMNHLFNPTESEVSIERSVKVQSLLRQHPCLTYSKCDRGGHDVNIRLVHQAPKPNYTASKLKVSERMAPEDFVIDNSPLLQPTKLRSRTNMPNYYEMVSLKTRVSTEPKSDLKKEPKVQAPRAPVRALSISERMRMNTENERLRRKEFSILRSHLRSTIEANEDAPLISILNKAQETIKNLEEDENMLKRTKRSQLFKRKKLISKLRADMRQFPSNHPCYRSSMELSLNLDKCDRAENFARDGLSKLSVDSSNHAVTASINSDAVRPIELSKQPSTIESSKQHSITESSKQYSTIELSKQHSTKKLGPAAASEHSKLKRRRNVNKCLWRKVVESRLEPRQQPRQQPRQLPLQQPRQQPLQQPCQQPRTPVFESSEIYSSPKGVTRSEHSYSKREIGLRRNSRWASSGIPRKEYQKLLSSPSSLLVHCDQQATDSSNERDQVAVYLTENDLPITKLIIQRQKSMNENSPHLTPTERRNQIIALIRKIVRETLTGTRSQAGSSNRDERYVVPQLLLLQRLLESADIQIRDSSMVRVIDQTIEIGDDDDQDEFCIESMDNTSDADNADGQVSKRRVYVKVTSPGSAQSNSSPLQNGISLTNSPAPVSSSSESADRQIVSDAATIIDEQLCVENQIILNSAGDQVDIGTFIDNMPSLKLSKRQRGTSNTGQRKLTVLKRVNGVVPADDDEVTHTDTLSKSAPPVRVDLSQKSNRSKIGGSSRDVNKPSNRSNVGSSNCGIAQRPQVHRLPNSEVRLLRDMLEVPVPPASPKSRLYARKTFSSPNYRKLIAQRHARREMLSPALVSAVKSLEIDCESTNLSNVGHVYPTELSDLPVDIAEESSVSISDYVCVLPDLLGKPISPNKSSVTRFTPNILVKSCKAKNSSVNTMVVPPSEKKVPLVLDNRFSAEERHRCPSFMPPSVHPTLPLETVTEKEAPVEMEASPVEESAVSPLENDTNMETVDNVWLYVENGSPMDEEPSTSRRSSMDSSTRLAIRSFASVYSFNDNCFNNMDRMLKF